MTLKPLRIVAVGRLKTPFWKAAAEHYVERLVRWRAFTESIIKDGDPSLPIVDRNALEGKGILSALSASDIPVVLDERGKTLPPAILRFSGAAFRERQPPPLFYHRRGLWA